MFQLPELWNKMTAKHISVGNRSYKILSFIWQCWSLRIFAQNVQSLSSSTVLWGLSVCVSCWCIHPASHGKVRFKSVPAAGFTTHSSVDSALPKDLPSTEAKNPDLFCVFLGPKGRKLQTLWRSFNYTDNINQNWVWAMAQVLVLFLMLLIICP